MTIQPEAKQQETKVAEIPAATQPKTIPEATPSAQPEETTEQINWRKFRQVREKERKEKEESDRRASEKEAEAKALKDAMEALLSKPQPAQSSEDIGETEEQRIDKRIQQALDKERQRHQKELQEREVRELPQKLKSTFNDFDQVCTQENLDYLDYHYPEVARRFRNSPESFETWSDFYKVIKRFVPNHDSKKDQKQMEKNLAKPQSMSLPGATQTGDQAPAKNLDDKRRQENWARMQRTLKGAK